MLGKSRTTTGAGAELKCGESCQCRVRVVFRLSAVSAGAVITVTLLDAMHADLSLAGTEAVVNRYQSRVTSHELPVAGQRFADADLFVLQLDVATFYQLGHYFADHLARCTDHVAKVLMCIALPEAHHVVSIGFCQFG